jgi:two-component system phosphate regulon sensor histidine kinase PhoR
VYIFGLVLAMLAGHVFLHANATTAISLSRLHAVEFAAVVAALAAGAIGMLGMLALKRRCHSMARALRAMPVERLQPLDCRDPQLAPLAAAINDLLDRAGAAITKANLHAKEMEILMKVATAERQHAEAIIYSISDGVLVTDSFDELVLANESAARTFEFDLAKSDRAPVQQLLRDQRMIGLIREMRQNNSRHERRVVEHTMRSPAGGGGRTYKVTLSCFADRAGSGSGASTDAAMEPAGVVAVLHDMTREKEVADMKNDFVSNVSHELRTPLASIKAYVEMLIDGEADDERTKLEFYEVIQNEANRLGRLIDDILNISRIESGLVKVNKQPISLGAVIKEAVEVITPQARQKNITVTEAPTPIYYQTLGDRDMLYQAVLNLLSNAIKYTPEGGSVDVRTVIDESVRTITLRVSDTGVGITPKDLAMVFEKFYRAEANSRMAKGTGLGLSLVKQIVETVHGGRVLAESQVGKGSCFGLELRLAE